MMTHYTKYEVRVYPSFSKEWYLNGIRHREDGPAVEYNDGYKAWYLNGILHREDGPAVEHANGNKSWYWNGVRMTEEEHKEAMNPAVEMTMEEICKALGKNVKVKNNELY
jgi:hypothetical protein